MPATISVIIPVYNGERFIRDALGSVCAQSHAPVEIVVADDVSTDSTRDIVLEFARTAPVPITLFCMDKNSGGPYGPASQAFHRTSGDYVCILDVDDMFAPEAFESYAAMFAAGPEHSVGLATSDFLTFEDGTGKVIESSMFARWPDLLARVIGDQSPEGILLDRDEAVRIVSSAFVIPFKGMLARRAWEELCGPNLDYICVCDCDFVWRLLTRTDFRVRVINLPLVRVRISGASMTSDKVSMGKELVRHFKRMLRDTHCSILRAEIRLRLYRELFDLTYNSYKKHYYGTFFTAAVELGLRRFGHLFRWQHRYPVRDTQ